MGLPAFTAKQRCEPRQRTFFIPRPSDVMAHINRDDEEFISSAEWPPRLQPAVIIKANKPVAEAGVKYLHACVSHRK